MRCGHNLLRKIYHVVCCLVKSWMPRDINSIAKLHMRVKCSNGGASTLARLALIPTFWASQWLPEALLVALCAGTAKL